MQGKGKCEKEKKESHSAFDQHNQGQRKLKKKNPQRTTHPITIIF